MERRLVFAILTAFLLALGAAGLAAAKEGKDDRPGGSDDDNRSDDDGGKDRMADEEGRHHKPRHGVHGDRFLFQNDHITVFFKQGGGKAKPDLRIAFNGSEDDERSGYRVKILRVYETGPNGTEFRGRMPSMQLTRADDWNVQTREEGESLTLTMVRAEAQGIVTLTWHVNTTSAEIKYDLDVQNWRWAADSTGHRLALDMLVVGKNLRNETGARVGVEEAGYIAWEPTGTVTYPNGSTATATVTAQTWGDDEDHREGRDDDDDDGERGTHLVLTFDVAPGYSRLFYDPTLGVQGAGAEVRSVPAPAPVALVGAVAAAAVIALRRRR